MQLTITEALQSIKIAAEKIAKKRSEIVNRVARDSRMVDPLAQKGGTAQYIAAELQSIGDLEVNIVKTRVAIQKANAENVVNIGGIERTVAEWLVWRREVAPTLKTFIGQVDSQIRSQRNAVMQSNRQLLAQGAQPSDITVNIDEKAWASQSEALGEVLGTLDGRLSAFNATHAIEL